MTVGSFHAELRFDSSAARVVKVTTAGSGLQAQNTNIAGRVNFAGAAPNGFSGGTLLTIELRPNKSSLPPLTLAWSELAATKGQSLLANAVVTGLPASTRALGFVERAPKATRRNVTDTFGLTPRPHISRLEPAKTQVEPEGVIEIVAFGSGFQPTGNMVIFAGAPIVELPSEDGTSIRFIVPATKPAVGAAGATRVVAGKYAIQIRNRAGTSNAVELILENPR